MISNFWGLDKDFILVEFGTFFAFIVTGENKLYRSQES